MGLLRRAIPLIAVLLLAVLGLTGCETPGRSALAGAAAGAAIGGLSTGRGRGALTGAAIGAGAGYLLGRIAQSDRRDRYYEDRAYYDDDYDEYDRPDRRVTRRSSSTPYGRRTDRYGFVVSPYRPYNLIDVRGIPRGARVIDPSADRAFINP